VLLDMVGDRALNLRRDTNSTAWLTDLFWSTARRLGHGAHFLEEPLPVEDDHIPFLEAGVPAVDLIDLDYPDWHTSGDTLDKVGARSLQIVGDVVLAALPEIEARLAKQAAAQR
jgi:Zn-dependent M28 family amino/carboxypeptidase